MNNNDHDILVSVVTKLDQLALDMREIKSDISTKIGKLEIWREQVDLYHAKVNYEDLEPLIAWTTRLKDNDRFLPLINWGYRIKDNFSLIMFLAGSFMIIIGGVLDKILTNYFHL